MAKELIDATVTKLKEKGMSYICSFVEKENIASKKLLESVGMKVEGLYWRVGV